MEKFADNTRSYIPADAEGQRMKFNAHGLDAKSFAPVAAYLAALKVWKDCVAWDRSWWRTCSSSC